MRNHGYSLIELMITIAIVAIIAVAALPMGSAWVSDANLEETEGQIINALGRAKASGIRNAAGKTGSAMVAIVCIDTNANTLKVMESTTSTEASCASGNAANQLWQTNIKTDIVVSDASSNAVSCLCTNNKGQLITAGTTCSSCYSGDKLVMSIGSNKKTLPIY